MLWKDGLNTICKEDAARLLAPLEAVGVWSLLKAKAGKRPIATFIQDREVSLLRDFSADALRNRLKTQLYSRAWVATIASSSEVAADRETLQQAAKGLGILHIENRDDADVEDELLRRFVERFVEQMKQSENAGSLDTEALTAKVKKNLTADQWQELTLALGTDRITADALGKVLLSTATGLAGAAAVNAAGFGIYLALTTAMASIAGTVGMVLPFAAYTSATSALSLLSGPFILLPLAGFGGWQAQKASRKVSNLLLGQALVMLRLSVITPAETDHSLFV